LLLLAQGGLKDEANNMFLAAGKCFKTGSFKKGKRFDIYQLHLSTQMMHAILKPLTLCVQTR